MPKLPKNFSISLQYLKKKLSDKVDFLHAGKQESFLQIDTTINGIDDCSINLHMLTLTKGIFLKLQYKLVRTVKISLATAV